ncbi:MAG: flagellar filament capping protein FliD [Veillonellaceae bacterium]|jgi:hypothetical protein|nr:flagellar filament capping protein FliD [Veillonellaceae bacterium]
MTGITSLGTTSLLQFYARSAGITNYSASSYSVQDNAKLQQVNKQITGLNGAAQELQTSLKAFSKSGLLSRLLKDEADSSSFQVLARDAVDKLVKAYNKFDDIIKSSTYITGEGAKLLDQVRELLNGKDSDDFRKLGLSLDKHTGKLKLDDKKLLAALQDDTSTAKKLIFGDKHLAPMLDEIVKSVLGKQAGYYFNKPFVVNV